MGVTTMTTINENKDNHECNMRNNVNDDDNSNTDDKKNSTGGEDDDIRREAKEGQCSTG